MSKVQYTAEEIQTISRLRDEGKTARQIGEAVGRTAGAIAVQLSKMRQQKRENTPPHREMSPREMIKHLYNLGYRIENNQLVCYTKNVVKIQDIIHGTD